MTSNKCLISPHSSLFGGTMTSNKCPTIVAFTMMVPFMVALRRLTKVPFLPTLSYHGGTTKH